MYRSVNRLQIESLLVGATGSAVLMLALLHSWGTAGVSAPPQLQAQVFRVAVSSGSKTAAKTAPEEATNVAEAVALVKPTDSTAPTKVVTADRDSKLPDAVQATAAGQPTATPLAVDEVIPPARVSMPGGRLAEEDLRVDNGAVPDILGIAAQTVYLRIFVNEKGQFVRGGIVRSGGDAFRDALIYKAMRSRPYDPARIRLKVSDNPPLWQLDLEIPYGGSDFLP